MRSDATPAYSLREPRDACDLEALVTDEGGRELLCRIANLSESGFMGECAEKVAADTLISLTLPGRGLVQAEIRWTIGPRFGAMILG